MSVLPTINHDAKVDQSSILDDPEIYDGAPVGVQIVARKFEEEKIWAIGKIVHKILQAAGVQ